MKIALVSPLVLGGALLTSQAMAAGIRTVDLGDSNLQQRTVTVYNSGFAHVQDDYTAVLQKGRVLLRVDGIPQDVDAGSVSIVSDAVSLKDIMLKQPPQTPQDYLQYAIGKQVKAVRVNPRNGRDVPVDATLLAITPSPILKMPEGLEVNFPGRIVLPRDIMATIPRTSVLEASADVDKTAKRAIKLQYKLSGLQWQANYLATYNEKDEKLHLQGRVGVANFSQTDFDDVKLRVVAGQVNEVSTPRPMARGAVAKMMTLTAEADEDVAVVTPIQSSGYHVYPLPEKVSLSAGAQKDITFLDETMPVDPIYVVKNPVSISSRMTTGWVRHDATLRLDIAGGADASTSSLTTFGALGAEATAKTVPAKPSDHPALPAGVMRVVMPLDGGADLMIGETYVPHVAADKGLSVSLGRAVDITTKSKQVSYSKLSKTSSEHSYEIVLSNSSANMVRTELQQYFPGEWVIYSESQKHSKVASNAVSWALDIPAKGEVTLKFAVRITR